MFPYNPINVNNYNDFLIRQYRYAEQIGHPLPRRDMASPEQLGGVPLFTTIS